MRFVAANMSIPGAAIDLIMFDRFIWVFVEGRYRRSASFDTASCRSNIIAITGSRVEWLKDTLRRTVMAPYSF